MRLIIFDTAADPCESWSAETQEAPAGGEGFEGQSNTFRMAAIPNRHGARLIVMVTRIVVFFHMGIALDPVATRPEGFVFASGRVDKPPLPDVSARLWLSAQLLAALCGSWLTGWLSHSGVHAVPVHRMRLKPALQRGEPSPGWGRGRAEYQHTHSSMSNRGQQKTPPERGCGRGRRGG